MFFRIEIFEIINFNCNYLGNLKFLKYREKIVMLYIYFLCRYSKILNYINFVNLKVIEIYFFIYCNC